MKTRPLILPVVAVLAAFLVFMAGSSDVARADPGPVQASYDLFKTESAELGFGLPNPPFPDTPALPADLFGPGSDPFVGTVDFKGVPFDSFGGFGGLLPTDTIMERLQDAGPPFPVGVGATIDIEIVRLELVSVSPITVTYNGGQDPEQWDVTAQVPEGDANQTPGTMTIYHEAPEHPDGGTFDAQFPVDPLMTFTRVSDLMTIGPFHLSDVGFPVFELSTTGAPWCHAAGPLLEKPGLTGPNFYPGLNPLNNCEPEPIEETHLPPWTGAHTVRPVVTGVGGTVELVAGGSDAPRSGADGSGSSRDYTAPLAAAATALAAVVAGGWYVRRWLLR